MQLSGESSARRIRSAGSGPVPTGAVVGRSTVAQISNGTAKANTLPNATVADFAPGHSVVEALCQGGLSRVFVTDWRSATPEIRYFSIDNYLADLNVAVDELGPPVDLIGLCQGGWLALVYAARFPKKVRRLVLVGAPIDIAAAESQLSRFVADVPLGMFDELVRQIQKSSDHRSLQQSGFTKSRSDHHSFYAPIRHSLVGFPRTRNGSVCVEQYNRR